MISNYFATGGHVVLDSGFCLLRGIANLIKRIFAGALIKKQQYWLGLVPGEAFDNHFKRKEVGDTDVVSGKLSGTNYLIWGMKEPNYVMKVMGSGGSLNRRTQRGSVQVEGWKQVLHQKDHLN